jgi:hypothetical protein
VPRRGGAGSVRAEGQVRRRHNAAGRRRCSVCTSTTASCALATRPSCSSRTTARRSRTLDAARPSRTSRPARRLLRAPASSQLQRLIRDVHCSKQEMGTVHVLTPRLGLYNLDGGAPVHLAERWRTARKATARRPRKILVALPTRSSPASSPSRRWWWAQWLAGCGVSSVTTAVAMSVSLTQPAQVR